MVLKYNFRGLMAPVFTPFTDSWELNCSIICQYANYLKEHGVQGILVNGTTGEGVSQNIEERKLLTEEWVKVAKKTEQSLMVHIGGASLTDVIDLAKHAEKLKVEALLCLPELFFKPKTSGELTDYLKLISKAAPGTPLLYYHIPAFTDVNIDMEQFIRLACSEVPTFAGIKFTHTNLEEGARCLKAGNEHDVAVFLGADQLLSAATTLGFDSAIATTLNLWPELLNEIQLNIKSGKVQKAMDGQKELTRKIACITKHGNWVTTMKAAMNLVSSLKLGTARPPLKPLTVVQIQEISRDILD
ncbi:N-acetylneuraminate lyase-like isoform X2 [Rhodnius prolixus]|uniref:N-acetylneuraminate lyase n=1 Tax=Rhodnius prolixus TaxID=13249 RepID=R4FL94_RHOPR